MGMSAQGSQGGVQSNGSQVFYDSETGQYYTQPVQQKRANPMMAMFSQLGGRVNNGKRNYLTDFNSPARQESKPYDYIDINALFPQLMQGAQGIAPSNDGLLGDTQGAAQSASSGAGRFM
jgi:hypothetical protein